MAKYKRIMKHHKRNHNGRTRVRKGDVIKHVDRTYYRPCGCRPADVAKRNQTIARAIQVSNPAYEWKATLGCWTPHVAKHITSRFGRCMRHFNIQEDLIMEQPTTPEKVEPSEVAVRAAASA